MFLASLRTEKLVPPNCLYLDQTRALCSAGRQAEFPGHCTIVSPFQLSSKRFQKPCFMEDYGSKNVLILHLSLGIFLHYMYSYRTKLSHLQKILQII